MKNGIKKGNRYTITMLLFLVVVCWGMIKMGAGFPIWIQNVEKEVKKVQKQETASGMDVLEAVILATENSFSQNLLRDTHLVDLYGLWNRAIGKDLLPDGNELRNVYRMDNGQLTFTYPKHGVETAVKQMKALNDQCKKNQTQLLYVQFPCKIDKYNNQLPHNRKDETNPNGDRFLERLKELDIDYLDYRETVHNRGIDFSSQFYVTDHHWKTEAAFEAYRYLLSYLQEQYGFQYDSRITDPANFNYITMPQSFIGAQAIQVGSWYAGVDDFTYIYPKFDTNFEWRKISITKEPDWVRKGRFEDAVLYQQALADPKTPMTYRDNCYFKGNPALAAIKNQDLPDGKKILFVVDSYGKPVVSFMSMAAKQVTFMDLRDYNKESLLEYLEKENYDYVIVAYTLNAFKGQSYKQCFNFIPDQGTIP